MKLNHLDLQFTDVIAAATRFESLFGFRWLGNRGSAAIAILTDDDGFTLVLQRRATDGATYPEGFHCGFLVDDVAAVHAHHARARAMGVEISDVIENGRGVLTYLRIEDVLVEVSWQKPRRIDS